MTFRLKRDFLAALALFGASLLIRLPYCTDDLLLSDSADYLRAARQGFWANYLDTGSRSLWALLDIYRRDPEFRAHPWANLMRRGELSALRHFHVPLFVYPHALAAQLGASNRTHRLLVCVTSGAFVALVFLVLRRSGAPFVFALSGALWIANDPSFLLISNELSPYPLYFLLAVLFLHILSVAERGGDHQRYLALSVFGAAAVATLEFSVILAAVTLIIGTTTPTLREAWRQAERRKTLVWCICAFIFCLLALWPAGIFKGGYFLSYGAYAYIVIFRRSEYYQEATIRQLLARLGASNFWLGLFYASAGLAASAWALRHPSGCAARPLALYCVAAFLQGLANNFRNPTYAAHFGVIACIVVCLVVAQAASKARRGAWRRLVGAWCVVCILTAGLWGRRAMARSSEELKRTSNRLTELIRILPENLPAGTAFLTDRYHEPLAAYATDFVFEPGKWEAGLVPRGGNRKPLVPLVDTRRLDPGQAARLGELCELGRTGFAVPCESLRSGVPAL